MDTDAIVVGAGLAGLVATAELADAGRKVILLDQEPEASLGGQAFWSFGGLFLVDSPEQRRLRIKRLARARLAGLAGHRGLRPRRGRVAAALGRGVRRLRRRREARLAARAWACSSAQRRLGRARRLPGDRARQLGAALPRHLGHRAGRGRAVRAPRARGGRRAGWSSCASATASTSWRSPAARSTGVRGRVLEPSDAPRGARRARATVVGEFALDAQAVIVTSGGIGANHELVRAQLAGAARHAADGDDLAACPTTSTGGCSRSPQAAGGNVINPDRMWHYTEGIHNWDPIWTRPRHPHPARAVVAVARRARAAAAGAAVPRLRHARHARAHHARPATTTPGSC